MPIDFTLATYRLLLKTLLKQEYRFIPFCETTNGISKKTIILRHDVDLLPENSLKTAILEHKLGIRSTYNFRTVPKAYDEEIIRNIAALSHETGYHYEDLALTGGDVDQAIISFQRNLEKLRSITEVKTMCMHGSPLSKWDSRKIWDKYDYHDYGIIGEPYFYIDFSEVLYLTDTGRRWDGGKVSVRDKVVADNLAIQHQHYHTTFDIIRAAEKGILPDQTMITLHPQRWTDRPIPWVKELVIQRVKNVVKKIIVWRHR